MDDRRLTTLLERAYPPPRPEVPSERVTSRAHALRRRRRIAQTLSAIAVVAAVVIGTVVVVDWSSTTKISTPPATKPHLPVPDVTVNHELLVSPSTGLRDGQPIRLSGRHFVVGVGHGGHASSIQVATCRAGATPANWDQQCDAVTSAGAGEDTIRSRTPLRKAKPHQTRVTCCVDMAGYQYAAVRHLNLPGGSIDCALEPCVVIAVAFDRRYGAAPLRFDAATAPLPTPRVTVTPNSNLEEGQQVTVQIQDAWPGGADKRGASVSLCSQQGAAPICDATDLGAPFLTTIDSQGRATLTMTLRSTVLSDGCCTAGATSDVTDCAQPPGCVIGVHVPAGPLGGQWSQLAAPITFSADVGARLLADRVPQATVDPPGPYTDGQEVTISATRVPKGTAVSQCAKFGPNSPPTFLSCAPETVTAAGTLALHRFLNDDDPSDPLHRKRIDCSEPGRCALYLRTTDPNRGGGLPPGALIEFAPLTVG